MEQTPPAKPVLPAQAASTPAAPAKPETARVAVLPPHTAVRFDPMISWWLLVLLIGGLAGAAWRANSRTTRVISAKAKLLLWGLRSGALLTLAFCLARPVSVQYGQLEEKAQSFIALDTSSSMNFRDAVGGTTRWEAAEQLFVKHRALVDALQAQTDLQRMTFDNEVRAQSLLPGEKGAPVLTPAGRVTNIAGLCERLAEQGAGVSTTGALLITDGRHNAPADVIPAAMALGRANIPLYVVGLGQDATPTDYRDVRIKQLVVPEKAFVGGRMRIGVEIESSLPTHQVVPLKIDVNGKKVFEGNIDLAAGSNVPMPLIEVPYVPEILGVHRVVATVGTLPMEANTANNTAIAFFRVFRTRIGVWYVEGSVRKEFGAIRNALESAPNVNLQAINAFMARSGSKDDLLPDEDEWNGMRLIIIGDLPASRFSPLGIERLAKFVEEGGSVLMIGGFNSFGAGGWHNTPLARVLPVEMSFRDGMADGPLPMKVGEDPAHPILKLAESPQDSASLWFRLPQVPGVNRIMGIKPAAKVLLQAGAWDLLIVQEVGKGRSGAFTSDMTWQWVLKANQPDAHKAFWRNMVTWLTRSDYRDTNKAVFADSDRLHYNTGDEAQFGSHVHETEKSAKDISKARVSALLVKLENGAETVLLKEDLGRGPGDYIRRLTLAQPGAYRFTTAAYGADNAVIDSDSLDVFVTDPDVENDNPRANLRLLRRIALLTGGMYYDQENADKAFASLIKPQAGYVKQTMQVQELWSSSAVLLIFMLMLSAEWLVRKKLGLI